MGEKEAKEILMGKGMTEQEAEDFIAGCKRGVEAMRKGDRIHWDDIKEELGLKDK